MNRNLTQIPLSDLKPAVQRAAQDAGVSMSTWIYWAVEEKLEREGKLDRPVLRERK